MCGKYCMKIIAATLNKWLKNQVQQDSAFPVLLFSTYSTNKLWLVDPTQQKLRLFLSWRTVSVRPAAFGSQSYGMYMILGKLTTKHSKNKHNAVILWANLQNLYTKFKLFVIEIKLISPVAISQLYATISPLVDKSYSRVANKSLL